MVASVMKALFSMKASVMYMFLLGVAVAVATFIENDYGTQSAQAMVYKVWWFEALLLLFTLAVMVNIVRYGMYRRPKWGQLILHASFVLIAVGALVTRYIGYEGILHLRNGEASKIMVSDHMVLEVMVLKGEESGECVYPLYLSSMGNNRFSATCAYQEERVDLSLTRYLPSARKKGEHYVTGSLKPGGELPQLITLDVQAGGVTRTVDLTGFKAVPGNPTTLKLGDLNVQLSYGAKLIHLPFSIKLDRFKLDRYPGSNAPSSYESYVTVTDSEMNTTFPYHIYMNHVLGYRGYRFFQSSYDMDEKGSILSVNHDPGTLPTYIGYFLLLIGFGWSFISAKGRMAQLRKRLTKLRESTAAIAVLAVMLGIGSVPVHASDPDPLLESVYKIDPAHALRFGKLVVQGFDGRMKPMDSLAREVLSKISRKQSWEGLSANQMILGMLTQPTLFQKIRLISVKHPMIIQKVGLPSGTRYVAYNDMFDTTGHYKLLADVQLATRKAAKERDQYDKELLKVDERLNIEYMIFQGSLLRLFPKPKDSGNKWISPIEAVKTFDPKLGEMVRLLVANYFQNIGEATRSGSWDKAETAREMIAKYQRFYGAEVMPSPSRIDAEIWYNKLFLFERLIGLYFIVGLLALFLSFASIVKPAFQPRRTMRALVGLLILAFGVHTFGMGLRWYVAGHAPWSDSYESLIYIAWAIAFAGFFFVKSSPLTMAATSILTGIFMGAAALSNIDPQITNLIPVLKSYWLTIHVAVITAGYGFLGLGALLGLLVLALMIFQGKRKDPNIARSIKELTYINEMSLLIGLALLTIGNFLGGVWANESWGRYWGWDPKEAWTAVTIFVYAVVIHLRFVPKFNTIYAFNVAAILAISTPIMTYFGVNYYLSGLHSYAGGDPVPVPGWVGPVLMVLGAIILWASRYRKNAK
jgi:cytochrome c-type biogenesis protein CcsB